MIRFVRPGRAAMLQFKRVLARRRLSLVALARIIPCGREHLTRVIYGDREGRRTWVQLARVLSTEELEAARAVAAAEKRRQGPEGPNGEESGTPACPVVQDTCSTWNECAIL